MQLDVLSNFKDINFSCNLRKSLGEADVLFNVTTVGLQCTPIQFSTFTTIADAGQGLPCYMLKA